ncbi:NADH dehydrogenase [ubiquinone] 1 alpha subcomplex subunit 5 [Chelonus insularis]|uniref:NADH dehydrogenase [ubiquinone] 1 alpha subcomplex subunit 5 n=1 Tax=Chelonus insularis TaxID=460826 RepID=UPI00158E76FA|nr:NADH dehydrogenase [ubiquinone] 1 alpha subcomplex subunit 5 [Chelonus insularis]
MAGAIKGSTFLKGLAVEKNPHLKLTANYQKLLYALAKLPETSAYRRHTESITKERLHHVQTTPNIEELEKKIDCGQVEELIVQARNETMLARRMSVWKPWEPLAEPPPPNQWTWPPTK